MTGFRFPAGGRKPRVEMAAAITLPVITNTWPDQDTGFNVNGRIHPRGRPTSWYVEYGATTSYGSTTAPRKLPGKLTAVFHEAWPDGVYNWRAGLDQMQLAHDASEGGFISWTLGGGEDGNHHDGVGNIYLGPFCYGGRFAPPSGVGCILLGGGKPDFRGAQFSYQIRGTDVDDQGRIICPWIQSQLDPANEYGGHPDPAPNWANTGNDLTGYLTSGEWEDVAITLRNRGQDWTFGGHNTGDGRVDYVYGELDTILRAIDLDFFLAMVLGVDIPAVLPTGTVDFRNLVITYRNHNVCAESNGGTLVSSPSGTDASVLTDGWRWGDGHTWQGDLGAFVYEFNDPITLESVTIHNDPDNPSEDVEVEVSTDGVAWTSLGTKTLPETHVKGSNFLFQQWDDTDGGAWIALNSGTPISFLRVTIESKYGATAGLGAIEAHGAGAAEETDNDWYDVNQDVIVAPGAYHYRIVTTSDRGTTYGPDRTVLVP